MDEAPNSNGSGNPEPPVIPATEAVPAAPAAPAAPSTLHKIFIGPNGIRAGWRFAIYLLIVAAIITFIRLLRGWHRPATTNLSHPVGVARGEWIAFATVAFSAWIMSRIEKQPWGNYGMAWRNAFRSRFWLGALYGFVALSCVMGALRLTHCYSISGMAIAGTQIWKYGAIWGIAFIGTGFFEEFLFRGYAQYTFASGMRFWPAAVLTSAIFLAAHTGNSGETVLGIIDVFLFGMLACFIWWRTGDLWFAVGFHAFWDWGLSFFYSVPDSGLVSAGHLFNIHVQGSRWLSGGSAGPEGSIFSVAVLAVSFIVIGAIFPKRKFVDMNERRQAAEAVPVPLIDLSALTG